MIRFIITDMDGTLLDDAHNFPPDYFDIVSELQPKGILFAVASGRQYYTLLQQFYDIKDSIIFIAENGTYVTYKDEVIYQDCMSKTDTVELIDKGRNIPGAFLILCGKNGAYAESNDVGFLNEAKMYYKRLEIVDDISKVADEILKFTVFHFESTEKYVYPHFKNYESDFKVAISGQTWLDITSKTANKGVAIKMIQQDFNIAFDETMVFGDFLNDLEMMANAKYSYAMKNAHTEILKAAAFITEFDNNDSGVTKTIRTFFPEKKKIPV